MNLHPDDIYHTVLISEILQGNVNAFEVIVEKYHPIVAKIVLKHVPRENAEEIAQDSLVRVFQSLKNYKGIQPFKHWLSKITLNCCYDYWREKYKNRETPISSLPESGSRQVEKLLAERSEDAFLQEAQRKETIELLQWALDQLSLDDRMLLNFTFFDGYSHAETAELLEWSVANVKTHSFRARSKLREILSRVIPETEG